ncbi:MAG: HAMP domain-containing sensor histidine kinase [bacterium]|nr:HAMP domain-containing sensor histidine kinase [bacterium]
MRHSIRARFAWISEGLLLLVLLSIWCLNTWFLESYYMADRQKALREAYELLDSVVQKAEEEGKSISELYDENEDSYTTQGSLPWLFREFNEQSGISILIIDNMKDKGISTARDKQRLMVRAYQYILGETMPPNEILEQEDNYVIQKTYDALSNSYYLECWGFFSDNSTVFLMNLPVTSIQESVKLSNRFLTYVGIAAILIGGLIIYVSSHRITKPILQLADLSEKMSNLNFDVKYEGKAEDEIGVLGKSMNTLSEKLKETIQELQDANIQLQKDIEEKEKTDEMRKEFIANVSHELKTPIALIQGYAEGLVEGMAEDKENRDYYCEVIMDEAGKMNTLVRQLLNLSALESGYDHVQIEPFSLTELIDGAVSAAKILVEQKEAKIQLDIAKDLYVLGDEFKIEEVMNNYLNNALNHLGGAKQIRIRTEERETLVRIVVFNTGNHIADEDLEKLWSKFYKVDKAHTREYGGSGLGLSIVKAIMESHQQAYGVRNVEDGVEFWFELQKAQIEKESKRP